MQFAAIKNDIDFRRIFGAGQKTALLTSFINPVQSDRTRKIMDAGAGLEFCSATHNNVDQAPAFQDKKIRQNAGAVYIGSTEAQKAGINCAVRQITFPFISLKKNRI